MSPEAQEAMVIMHSCYMRDLSPKECADALIRHFGHLPAERIEEICDEVNAAFEKAGRRLQ